MCSPGHVILRSTQEESLSFCCSEENMFLFGASKSLALYCCTYHAYRIGIQYSGTYLVPGT